MGIKCTVCLCGGEGDYCVRLERLKGQIVQVNKNDWVRMHPRILKESIEVLYKF